MPTSVTPWWPCRAGLVRERLNEAARWDSSPDIGAVAARQRTCVGAVTHGLSQLSDDGATVPAAE